MAADTAGKIGELQSKLEEARELLDDIRLAQGEDSDESNADNLQEAYAHLDGLDGAVGDLVP